MQNTPWIKDLVCALNPVQLDRAAFVALYFPRYVDAYRPPSGIILRPDGRPTRTTPGNVKAQQTKRENRVDAAFASYQATFAEVVKLNARSQ